MIGALLAMLFQTVGGAPAPAPVATTPAPAAAEAAQETETEREVRLREIRERQKLVCRNERVIGSRLPVRRCTSAADDANETNDSRQWIDRVQSQMPTKGG